MLKNFCRQVIYALQGSKFKSLSKIDRFLPSTIQTIHVPLLAKAVAFTIEEFSTRNNKVDTLF
jgi:hypothetical protein